MNVNSHDAQDGLTRLRAGLRRVLDGYDATVDADPSAAALAGAYLAGSVKGLIAGLGDLDGSAQEGSGGSEFPTCAVCGEPDVEDDGAHYDATGHRAVAAPGSGGQGWTVDELTELRARLGLVRVVLADLRAAYPDPDPLATEAVTIDRLDAALTVEDPAALLDYLAPGSSDLDA